MPHILTPHPDFPCPAVASIEVEILRAVPTSLELRYMVFGDIGDLLIPPEARPERTDRLWMRSCFEAFVGIPGEPGYREFNLSPSTRWAAYSFTAHRSGMADVDNIAAPRIDAIAARDRYELRAMLDVGLPRDADWELGLAAVAEASDGSKSFWALAHPPGTPDFHDRGCFILKLPSPIAP